MADYNQKKTEYDEKVVEISRVSRTMKGGRRISFRALVVIGDRHGKVGFGLGKGKEVSVAIDKAKARAKKKIVKVEIVNNTIPRPVTLKFNSAKIILKPAPIGTSIIAGGSIRAVVELAGIKNIVAKIIGSSNKINNAKATILALRKVSK
ncbi:30S ribosomal protein S5 [Candidatus Berkelbacteria bacterium CG_4_9_14_3_um_filter_39_23]|uniref:Small ribosomal subunit protein uS5 n=2 Tax=Candidatus Berkelbacteria TaxID=1618330 RepID=A0A2M7CJ69_9BACT|nr:30S ribosomal protein S5 [Candidatus Berkelbacteria bacterium]OIP06174.1 MAG: 30S ribosomal protein S5 [Candidatus Berkelbacteria bacterium CG2_30_39_44]PIR28102.1 MAG: 30S ribosomal protein S5 [Candidatus Berkelbacteria bacterium CG11_big_fil_rev_8_21_14_0_20_40_23]PIV25678.1 MAG: 30S ribosomal protein S5 [Candidatus Berkelbacteria bacterium CG03_land_8_20_14_0_80_40_36]PIX30436.1 MAG: 30S ribosomal protein S5 [Candidatus Berkelbacteria bacterium CG_4_8_14_3_um_filter_39_27]PIZ28898.1 MAG: